jgi:hypothetical protein
VPKRKIETQVPAELAAPGENIRGPDSKGCYWFKVSPKTFARLQARGLPFESAEGCIARLLDELDMRGL